ncbi:hypothetical protein [Streptomyces sp. NPDC005322]|uniref:hypothetical protein n=1 Tax=unclassified Streptomyces TaxID=2593676 RepID=UPI0033A5019F
MEANWSTSYARRGGGGKRVAVAVVVEDQGASGARDGGPAARIAKRITQDSID